MATTATTVASAPPATPPSSVTTPAPAVESSTIEAEAPRVVAPVVGVAVVVVGVAGVGAVAAGAGLVVAAAGVGDEVGAGFEGVELEGADVGAVEDDGVELLDLDGFLLGVGAGVGVGFALEDADGVGVGVEGVEAVLDEVGLSAGEVDEDLGVLEGIVDADVHYAAVDAELGVLVGELDGADGAASANADEDAGSGYDAGGALVGLDELARHHLLDVGVVSVGVISGALDGRGVGT